MITIDDTQVELLSYPLWVVWQEAFESCSSIQIGETPARAGVRLLPRRRLLHSE